MTCIYCNKITKSIRSKQQHEIRCHLNPNRIIVIPSYGMLGKKGSNQYIKGTAKPISLETRVKLSEASKKQVWSEERRKKHSAVMKKAVEVNPESYTSSNRGRTKQIEFDGIKFQGNWELEFYKWAKEQGLQPKRATIGFKYEWNGTRTYYPDFYIESKNLYVEVKGYETDRDRAKWLQFTEKLCIIKEVEIKQIRNKSFKGL